METLRQKLLHPLVALADPTLPNAQLDGASDETQPLARIGERPIDWPRKRAIWEAMQDVHDDQFNSVDVNLVDMGYIYDVHARGNEVRVLMTMPHKGRPKYDFLAKPLRARLEQVPGLSSVVVDFTWEPLWTPNRLSDAARQAMGLVDA